jgi:hypothetical protein
MHEASFQDFHRIHKETGILRPLDTVPGVATFRIEKTQQSIFGITFVFTKRWQPWAK